MKLIFAGTRGEIEARTNRHRRHSVLLVEYRGRRVQIDRGADWLRDGDTLRPHALVLTHAHPDHAHGLRCGCSCPVYATDATWSDIDHYPIPAEQRHLIEPRRPIQIEGITFEAFTVEHSIRCPAVSYRIAAGRVVVHYAPDVVYIHDRSKALRDVRLYIGDGATLTRPLVRRRGKRLIGHAPIRTQLTWCEKEGVPEALITHCGSQIVTGDERAIAAKLRAWARERGVEIGLAHDGMERVLR